MLDVASLGELFIGHQIFTLAGQFGLELVQYAA